MDKKWISIQVNNFFNTHSISESTDLIDFFAYFMDMMQQENFKSEKLTPMWFLENTQDLIDVDKNAPKELYQNIIPDDLSDIIDKTITWQNFIKISKKVLSSKGTISNIKFWLDLISEYDLSYFYYDNQDDITILKRIGINSDVYENTTDNYYNFNQTTYNKIPNILRLENINLKDDFTINNLSLILETVKPLGVIFLIYKFLLNNVIAYSVNNLSRKSKLYGADLQLYPNYTDIGLIENNYTLNDFKLIEIDLIPLDDIINNSTFLEYNYFPKYTIINEIETETILDLNDDYIDGNNATYAIDLNDDILDLNG